MRGNKVIRVGSNREIQRLRRAQTIVIDAKGGAVVPGFNDAHAHLISGGLSLDQVSLDDATTLDEIKDTIRVWSEAHPEREWITGRGWYYQPFGGAMPTRQLLDSLVPDRPAYLIAYDGHTGLGEHAALKAAGITRTHQEPAQRHHREGSAHRRADRRVERSGDGADEQGRAAADRRRSPRRHSRRDRRGASPRHHQRAGRRRHRRRSRAVRSVAQAQRADAARLPGARAPTPRSPKPDSTSSSRCARASPTIRCSRPARSSWSPTA